MDFLNIFVCVSTTLLCLILYYIFVVLNYWKNLGIPYVVPTFPFGNIGQVIRGKISFADQIGKFYNESKNRGKYIGLYFFHRKVLLVTDPNLVKSILSSDFKYFYSRGIYTDEKNDPLTAHLVSLNGERWKRLRNKLSPTFTTNKLRIMFQILLDCSAELNSTILEEKSVEIKDVSTRFMTDVVCSSALGFDGNSLKNPEAEIRKVGVLSTTPSQSMFSSVKRILVRNFPTLFKTLKLKIIDPYVTSFFLKTTADVIDYRKRNNVARKDFLHYLMDLMDDEDMEVKNGLNLKQVAAQCFVFFIAGVETSASTVTFALYELARNQRLQEKLRKEIDETFRRHEGRFTYDGILEMKLLDKVVLGKYILFKCLS